MQSSVVSSDIVLSGIVALGMVQMAWFSVMLVRRGAPVLVIQTAIPALLTVWVLMWPVYVDKSWLVVDFGVFLMLMISSQFNTPFFQHLSIAWSHPSGAEFPQSQLFVALCIAASVFSLMPAFGFAMALCLCVGFPAAYWADILSQRYGLPSLHFSAHPQQSLAGHLLFIALGWLFWTWSFDVYPEFRHQYADGQMIYTAALGASAIAALCRARITGLWNMPITLSSMALIMMASLQPA